MIKPFTKSLLVSLLFSTSVLAAESETPLLPTQAMTTSIAHKQLLTDITKAGDNLVAVGERGHIVYSKDGKQWQQANVPVNVLLTAVAFNNQGIGFATGHDATLLKSTDSGQSWQLINFQPELDKPLLDVVVDGDRVYATGAYGLFWQSLDGGNNWQSRFLSELLIEDDRLFLEELKEFEPEAYDQEKQFMLPHFNSMLVDGNRLTLVGEAGFLAQSNDNGDSWQLIEGDYLGSYFSLAKISTDKVIVAGLRGNAFITNNQLNQWQSIKAPAAATINNAVISGDKVYLFANSGNLFVYQNGKMAQKVFSDGKAIMAGQITGETLVLATEAGVKRVSVATLKEISE